MDVALHQEFPLILDLVTVLSWSGGKLLSVIIHADGNAKNATPNRSGILQQSKCNKTPDMGTGVNNDNENMFYKKYPKKVIGQR